MFWIFYECVRALSGRLFVAPQSSSFLRPLAYLSLGRPRDQEVDDDAISDGNQLGHANARLAAVRFDTRHTARARVDVTVDAALDGGQRVVASHQAWDAQLGVDSATDAVLDVEENIAELIVKGVGTGVEREVVGGKNMEMLIHVTKFQPIVHLHMLMLKQFH